MVTSEAMLLFLFLATVRLSTSAETALDLSGCECVPYYQCDENRRINIFGQGLLDERIPSCPNAVDVCCLPPPGSGGTPQTERPSQPYPFEPVVQPTGNPQPSTIKIPWPVRNNNYGRSCGVKRITERVDLGDSYRITADSGSPEPTGFGEFPWMVAVFKVTKDGNVFICGGSLIRDRVVMTGAHCVAKSDSRSIKIRAGEWDTVLRNEPISHQDRSVDRIISHPEFNPDSLFNDIALLVLDSPLEINDAVDTICLPTTDYDASKCIATGWGKNDFGSGGVFQTILRKVSLPLVERNECQERLRKTRLGKYFRLHESFICAGGIPKQDTCTGDGGGPLFCEISGKEGVYTQVGIVAWGIECGNENPAVYASVQHVYPWINNQLSRLDLECREGCNQPVPTELPERTELTTGSEEETIPIPENPGGSECGVRRIIPSIGFRISGQGGIPEVAGFGEFPWMIAIFRMVNGRRTYVCGGSLLEPSLVLTAAHCVNSMEALYVRAGDWDLEKQREPIIHQDRQVEEILVHPEFRFGGLLNDIALLKTDTPFELGPTVDKICLSGSDVDTTNCIATGWGKNDFGPKGNFQSILRGVGLSVVDRSECQTRLRNSTLGKYFQLHESFMCAGGIPEYDTCTGDGGGPLVCPTRNGHYVQVGIVSWGLGCASEYPAVYVSTERFSPWLSQHLL